HCSRRLPRGRYQGNAGGFRRFQRMACLEPDQIPRLALPPGLWLLEALSRDERRELCRFRLAPSRPSLASSVPHLGWPIVRGRFPGLDTSTDRKSTRLNSSHLVISYAVFCLKKKTRTGST